MNKLVPLPKDEIVELSKNNLKNITSFSELSDGTKLIKTDDGHKIMVCSNSSIYYLGINSDEYKYIELHIMKLPKTDSEENNRIEICVEIFLNNGKSISLQSDKIKMLNIDDLRKALNLIHVINIFGIEWQSQLDKDLDRYIRKVIGNYNYNGDLHLSSSAIADIDSWFKRLNIDYELKVDLFDKKIYLVKRSNRVILSSSLIWDISINCFGAGGAISHCISFPYNYFSNFRRVVMGDETRLFITLPRNERGFISEYHIVYNNTNELYKLNNIDYLKSLIINSSNLVYYFKINTDECYFYIFKSAIFVLNINKNKFSGEELLIRYIGKDSICKVLIFSLENKDEYRLCEIKNYNYISYDDVLNELKNSKLLKEEKILYKVLSSDKIYNFIMNFCNSLNIDLRAILSNINKNSQIYSILTIILNHDQKQFFDDKINEMLENFISGDTKRYIKRK